MKTIRTATILILLTSFILFPFSITMAQENSAIDYEQYLVPGVERNANPDISTSATEELVEGNSTFAFYMYQWLVQSNDNLIFSPYSISTALAMTYAGSEGRTKTEMADVLRFTLSDEELHPAFNLLDLTVQDQSDVVIMSDERPFTLNIANSLWLEQTIELNPAFLNTVYRNYGASLGLLDFVNDPGGSTNIINGWINEKTNELIPDAVPQGAITPITVLALVNAIYFYANWAETFDEGLTTDEPFFTFEGGSDPVPMMHKTRSFMYTEGDGFQAVRIPYAGRRTSMVIFLPEMERFGDFQESLNFERASEILGAMENRDIELSIPKFEFGTSLELGDTLSQMGMPSAFSGGFGPMLSETNPFPLFITRIIHKALISVDEEGTEAAAVTIVIMGRGETMPPENPIEFNCDHPFIFMILDDSTDSILFMGRVLDPSF